MKVKVSVSLPRDLLEEIDEEAAHTSRSRSQIFEVWLRLVARRRAAERLEQDTLAYYARRNFCAGGRGRGAGSCVASCRQDAEDRLRK